MKLIVIVGNICVFCYSLYMQRSAPLYIAIIATFFIYNLFFVEKVFSATGILNQINFQGKVVNKTAGTNISDGTYSFVFSIYSVSSGGAAIWTETKNLTVTNGIFQTLLGDTTSLPGSIDFNTDNLYLGINFNSDGEMSPRVRFSAVPYAFNAKKVAGLTVTDTTGTLTIPNSKTVSFGGAFTTSGANDVTLTTSGTTTLTLPTTGTLATLAGTEVLTNKSIGSTGLTFSGATTDITTGTNEDMTITANGTGDIVFTTDADTTFTISNLNCTGNTNGGALTADATGLVTCSDDDTGTWTLAGDSGSSQTISSSDTASIVGGTNGIDTVASATDTLTLDIDTTEIGTTTFGSGSDFTWTFNSSGATDPTLLFGNGSISPTLTATGLFNVLTGNLKVGNGAPSVTLNGEDAYVEGTFEADGASRFDGAVTTNSTLTAAGTTSVFKLHKCEPYINIKCV
jgi:hypothetical protein